MSSRTPSRTKAAAAAAAPTAGWSFNHSSAAHASAQFCPDCQSILDLPDADLILRCPTCQFQVKFSAENSKYEKLSISTKYTTSAAAVDEDEPAQMPAFTRAKVKERCPQCNAPEMSFYTMQMRSVDEGQTVFFECNKCGHTFSTNT